ncbi:hypothetical protein [Candidatus Kuenenia stuttgartiensis]|jgi:predicted RNase H-like HicB family nuclease|uniref:hypothetical protein n=1 Tax=Kuenenia stuttgartiensis TaxID=174633 RepID=UPI0013EA60BE|nr:hypothetical protein [Candidatus Kuenenia stuttgartiensis]MCL4727206.1 hypothetical protein [Candidatus Kuenenia stuttgartiensis]MCZ7611824.1 hypothetical protein [Ignavibacterium sp.]
MGVRKMTILKALTGSIENLPSLRLHILLTKEDDVIVARCLDFSVSSHGNSETEALNSLSDSIKDYIGHAIEHDALDEIIDPDEDEFWEAFRKSELQDELLNIKENIDILKTKKINEVTYA